MKRVVFMHFCSVALVFFVSSSFAQMAEYSSARSAADRGDYKSAIDALEKLIVKSIDDMEMHKLLIDCYVKADKLDQFAEFYKGLKLNFPGNRLLTKDLPDYFYNQGLSNKASGNFILAYGYFSVVDNLKARLSGRGQRTVLLQAQSRVPEEGTGRQTHGRRQL